MSQTESPLLGYAKFLFQNGQLQESEQIFQQVITSGENITQGYYGIGMVRLSRNDLDGARTHLQTALQHDPTYANALYQLGIVAEIQKNIPEALVWYRNTLQSNPQHVGAQQKIALLSPNIPLSSMARPFAEVPTTPANTSQDPFREINPAIPTYPSAQGNMSIFTQKGTNQPVPFRSNTSPEILLPPQYGGYDYLLDDSSRLARQTLATIDAIRFGKVRPSLTAYLDLLPRLFLALFFLVAILVSLREFIDNTPVYTSFYLFPGTLLLHIMEIVRQYIHVLAVPDTQTWLRYSWLAVTIILALFTLKSSLKVLYGFLKAYLTALTGEYSIDKGRLQITWGIFKRTTTNVELLRVRDVTLHKSFINRLTGDGTILLLFDRGGSMFNMSVKGLTRGRMLEDIYSQLLNLVSMLRSNSNSKGIIQ